MLMAAYAAIAVLLTYFAPEIVRILATEEYYDAIYIMPPIAAGVFFTSYANLYSNIAVYYKKTKFVMYPAIVAACINLGLNYVCIKAFGYMAAAYTTLVSYIVLALLQVLWSKKVCEENNNPIGCIFDNKMMFILAIVTIIASFIAIPLYSNTMLRYIVIAAGLVVVYFLVRKILNSGFEKNNNTV